MRTFLAFWAIVAVLALPQAAAQSDADVEAQIEALHGDSGGFNEALQLLQEAMRFGDPVTVAQLAAYPLTVEANGEVYDVLEEQDLVDNFDFLVSFENAEQDCRSGVQRAAGQQRRRHAGRRRDLDESGLPGRCLRSRVLGHHRDPELTRGRPLKPPPPRRPHLCASAAGACAADRLSGRSLAA
ncbi:MAG TPA: hypothetical protein VHG92_10055 [Afifellaceae bacterium]|nr:hypothetical protein [Afifellaceae bacterium]